MFTFIKKSCNLFISYILPLFPTFTNNTIDTSPIIFADGIIEPKNNFTHTQLSIIDHYDENNIEKYENNIDFITFQLVVYTVVIGIFVIRPYFLFSSKEKGKQNERKNKVVFFDVHIYEQNIENDMKENITELYIHDSDVGDTHCLRLYNSNIYENKSHGKNYNKMINIFQNILDKNRNTIFISYNDIENKNPSTFFDTFHFLFNQYKENIHFIDLKQFAMISSGNFNPMPKEKFLELFYVNSPHDLMKVYKKVFRTQLISILEEQTESKNVIKYDIMSDKDLFERINIF